MMEQGIYGNLQYQIPRWEPLLILAENDVIINCNMLSAVQQLVLLLSSGPCQPITVQIYVEWNWLPIARNSIHFHDTRMRARISSNDIGGSLEVLALNETALGSGRFTAVSNPFMYPVEDVCTFSLTAFPMMLSDPGNSKQPNCVCRRY